MLSQNGANRKFKAIPATRHAQTRSECHWLRQQRIGAQLTRDFEWIGVEVKHIPDALDDKEQPTGIREADTNGNRALTFFKESFDTATECIQGNGPPVTTSLYNLNTRSSPERQKRQHPVPLERASKAEAKQVLVVRLYCRLVREFANVCRGPLVRLANRRIEVTDASEAGGECDLLHTQSRFVDQLFGEMQPACLRYFDGRRTQVLLEQAAQMAGPNPEAARQGIHAAICQRTLADQTQCSRNRCGRPHPRRCSWRTLRTAPEAGTEAGFRRGRGRSKVAHIPFLGSARRADGTAVHPATQDSDEDASVEARVARLPRLGTRLAIQLHIVLD